MEKTNSYKSLQSFKVEFLIWNSIIALVRFFISTKNELIDETLTHLNFKLNLEKKESVVNE